MPEEHDNRTSPQNQVRREENVSFLEPALWRTLVEAQSPQEFGASWLVLQALMIPGTVSGMVGFGTFEDSSFAPAAFYPAGLQERTHFVRAVEQVFSERKGVVLRADAAGNIPASDQKTLLVGYPVWLEECVSGVAVLEIRQRSQKELQSVMRQLQWGCSWLQNHLLQQQIIPRQQVQSRLQTVLELSLVALNQDTYKGAALAVATELAQHLECDRVSVGYTRFQQAKIGAVSHMAQFGKQMNLIRLICNAMDEAMDQAKEIVWPAVQEQDAVILRAHQDLVEATGNSAVATFPCVDEDGHSYGAMTFERKDGQPFDQDALDLCATAADLLGPILEEKRLNDRNILVKVGASSGHLLGLLIGPRHVAAKLVVLGLIGLGVFFWYATGDYRITAKATLEGQVRRALVAPFQGYLYSAEVRAGDVVREGQQLASLDARDLQVERNRWASQRTQHQLEYRKAIAEEDTAAARIFYEQTLQAELQLKLLDEQIARAQIVAPFDGIVVSGDLSQALGSPVAVGDTLFELAPLDRYRLMLQVNERDIDQVAPGQEGALILNSLPHEKFAFTVTKITPVSEAEEGNSFFLVEADLANISERLRPRMEGFGKITVGENKLIWIWTHELIVWFRLWIWTWWP